MIEILSENDFEWINEIHKIVFKKELSINDLRSPYKVIGIKKVCYMIYTVICDEAEIIFIAVKDEYRRNGFAKDMINFINSDIFLDVNENNFAAINLYKKCGFKEYSRRKLYYKDADAILMKYERK